MLEKCKFVLCCLCCLYFCLYFSNQVSQAMSKLYVKVLPSATVTEAFKLLHDNQQNCALVVDPEDYLEGIITLGDIRRMGFELHEESFIDGDYPKTDVCLHGEINFFLPIKTLLCALKIWQDHCSPLRKNVFLFTT